MRQKGKYFKSRTSHLQKTFSIHNLDGLTVLGLNNIRYLSGFTGSEGVLLMGASAPVLFIDGRYTAQAIRETSGIKIVECSDRIEALTREINRKKYRRVGFEADAMAYTVYGQLKRRSPGVKWIALSDAFRMLRALKDDHEIALLRKGAEISSSAVRSLIHRVRPGWTEKELAWQLETEARNNGADGVSFPPIVASGANSSLPHAKLTGRKIKKGDFVVIDFGIRYKGYCSDETCTIAFGKLTDRQKNAYQIVKEAHDRALDAVAAGVPASEIDKKARGVFGKKHGRYFVHGTGHGLGLDIHEAPRLSSVSGDILQPQMVFTIEPGLYIPGLWGIRIEDTILLKENGCEKLTKVDKKLTIIE